MKKQLVLMLLLLSSNFVMAQFDNKFSFNIGATYWAPPANGEQQITEKEFYNYNYGVISEEEEELTINNKSGYGLNIGLQFNLSRRFAIEGLVRFSSIEFEEYYYSSYIDYKADQFETVYTTEGKAELYTKGAFDDEYAFEEALNGNVYQIDFAIVPKFYINPSNKFKLYLFSELHLNYSGGIEYDYEFIDSEGGQEKNKGSQQELNTEDGFFFGFIPGAGIDIALNNNLGIYIQSGYSVAKSNKNYLMAQCGLRISAFKSKSL